VPAVVQAGYLPAFWHGVFAFLLHEFMVSLMLRARVDKFSTALRASHTSQDTCGSWNRPGTHFSGRISPQSESGPVMVVLVRDMMDSILISRSQNVSTVSGVGSELGGGGGTRRLKWLGGAGVLPHGPDSGHHVLLPLSPRAGGLRGSQESAPLCLLPLYREVVDVA
jgi:hypothetical protein